MTERPILFNTEMVKAILEGRKIVTRRPVKPQPLKARFGKTVYFDIPKKQQTPGCACIVSHDGSVPVKWTDAILKEAPFGQIGDRLYVRETAIISPARWCNREESSHPDAPGGPRMVQYLATDPDRDAANDYGLTKATPSIHMPKWAARIWLEITDIRVERVQDITWRSAKAEGVNPHCSEHSINTTAFLNAFERTWNSIYKNWDANPWVWVVEFKVVSPGPK